MSRVIFALVLIHALTACTVEPVDFSEKTCPCDQGFTCDELANRCVLTGTDAGGDTFDSGDAGDGGAIPGLVAYYPLDDEPATSAVDPSASGPTLECGVPGVCPSSDEGRVGRAFSFRGGEDFMVGVDDGRLVTPVALTAAAFVRPATLSRGTAFAKLRESPQPGAITWALGIDGAGRAGFAVGTEADGESRLWSEPFVMEVGRWTHLAGTWDGIAIRLYVDGVEVAAGAGVASSSRAELLVGGNGASSSALSWNGEVDEARLYDRALEAAEIGRLASP